MSIVIRIVNVTWTSHVHDFLAAVNVYILRSLIVLNECIVFLLVLTFQSFRNNYVDAL